MSGTSVGNSSFVLGKEDRGNRDVRVYQDGESYSMTVSELTAYTSVATRFPYTNPS